MVLNGFSKHFYIFADARKFTPGLDFSTGGEGYVRFSYANSLANICEGLDRISRYLSRSGF